MIGGELLWTPTQQQVRATNLAHYLDWLAERGQRFDTYDALWQWSVTDIAGFWESIWGYVGVEASTQPSAPLGRRAMPGAEWFPGARLNYAQHILRNERPGETALYYLSETAPLTAMSWDELADDVRRLATALRASGVQPGDRVVGYLPNTPHAVIALLATTSIGAVWASCSPDFGWHGALDRFKQLEPRALLCVDGYTYGGKQFDRRGELSRITDELPQLTTVVHVPSLFPDDAMPSYATVTWADFLDSGAIDKADFEFEQVPFDHPLWTLFSSGTTGLPKAIVHGHGGILLEHFKSTLFHFDMHPGERAFFYTTTGWMMFNIVVSSMLNNVIPVFYDGNPAYPDADVLWKMAQDCGASFFGASPTYVDIMARAGIVPKDRFDLSNLRAVMPAGSPVSATVTAWFYENVKEDLWVATGSGGTDCCTGFVGGVATLPVYAGEIQARSLGVAAAAFNDAGEPVIGEVGELVITEPMPSMPVKFWGDEDGSRYRESYFDDFPGVWRHGDFFMINERGGCFVLGRSDATLNRYGIRIGTAEIYRALEGIDGIVDGLIVNLEYSPTDSFMPLFVQMTPGVDLTEELADDVKRHLRSEYTPRHVPDVVVATPEIPMTLTGKKMEVPVRKILLGADPAVAANINAMRNPDSLNWFVDYRSTLEAGRHGSD